MEIEQTEGIILHAIPFKESDRILKVFTPDLGIITLIIKRASSGKSRVQTEPLTRAEFIFVRGRGEIGTVREISLLNQYNTLRKDLSWLEAGCSMAKEILRTQMPEIPARLLYILLITYLETIPFAKDPRALSCSMHLKILRHEGHFGISSTCALCQTPLTSFHIMGKEALCKTHALPGSLVLTEDEGWMLLHLAYCRSIEELSLTELTEEWLRQFALFLLQE